MPVMEIPAPTPPIIAPRRSAVATSRQSKLNNRLAWALLPVVALSPLPFGSVHGFTQGAIAAYIGLVAMFYCFGLVRLRETFRVPVRTIWPQAVMFGLLCLYLVLQILPLANLAQSLGLAQWPGDVGPSISVTPQLTMLVLMRQASYALFFFLVLQSSFNQSRGQVMLDVILVSIVAYALLGIISLQSGDTVLGIPKRAYLGSATGPFVNRNSFATFLAFGCVIALAQLGRRLGDWLSRNNESGSGVTNLLYLVAYVLLFAVVIATQSRMGLFVSLLGSAVVGLATVVRSVRAVVPMLLIMLTAVVAILAGLYLFGGPLLDRVLDLEQATGSRSEIYRQVLELISHRPWTGFGGGSFELAFPLVHHEPVSSDYGWDRAHNTYLALWSELGYVAGSLPILMCGLIAIRLLIGLVTRRGSWLTQTIALAALVLSAAHSLVDFSLEIPANALMLLMLIGMGMSSNASPPVR